MARQPCWKIEAYEQACEEIWLIEDDPANKVHRLTDYHWRINGMDVWPSSKKYMRNGVVRTYNGTITAMLKQEKEEDKKVIKNHP